MRYGSPTLTSLSPATTAVVTTSAFHVKDGHWSTVVCPLLDSDVMYPGATPSSSISSPTTTSQRRRVCSSRREVGSCVAPLDVYEGAKTITDDALRDALQLTNAKLMSSRSSRHHTPPTWEACISANIAAVCHGSAATAIAVDDSTGDDVRLCPWIFGGSRNLHGGNLSALCIPRRQRTLKEAVAMWILQHEHPSATSVTHSSFAPSAEHHARRLSAESQMKFWGVQT
jgi:hypothetical protein